MRRSMTGEEAEAVLDEAAGDIRREKFDVIDQGPRTIEALIVSAAAARRPLGGLSDLERDFLLRAAHVSTKAQELLDLEIERLRASVLPAAPAGVAS